METNPEQPKLPAPTLTAQEFKFVDAYCQYRDAAKAAVEAGFQSKQGNSLYRRPAIHEEITSRLKNIAAETDKLIAKKRVVNVETLDRELMRVVTLPRKSLLETPSLATPKVNAIELGYRRTGLLMDDNFIPDAGSAAATDETARIFRPAGATIITHRVVETREVVTKTEAPPPPPKAEPVTIDAADWKDF